MLPLNNSYINPTNDPSTKFATQRAIENFIDSDSDSWDLLMMLLQRKTDFQAEYNAFALETSLKKEAFALAVRIIQNNCLKPAIIQTTLMQAAKNGHLEIVQELFKIADISLPFKETLCGVAAKNGHLEIVKEICKEDTLLDPGQQQCALCGAAEYGHLDIVKYFITKAIPFTEGISQACVKAAGNNHVDILTLLLSLPNCRNKITSQDRDQILSVVATNKSFFSAIVRVLISLYPLDLFTNSSHSSCIQNIAINGGMQIIQELFDKDVLITPILRIVIVRSAAGYGDLKVLKHALATGDITQSDRGWAVDAAAEHGYLKIVKELLKEGATIPENARGRAVANAARGGYLELVRELLKDEATIPENARGAAVKDAAKNGHLAIVTELLKEGATITEFDRGRAVANAARGGYLNIIEFLLPDAALRQRILTQSLRQELVLFVSRRGHRDVLEFLLRQGPITVSTIDSARTQAGRDLQAAANSRGAILDLLEMAQIIPDPPRGAGVAGGASLADDRDALFISFDQVKAEPATFLALVVERFPRRIKLFDSPSTIDLGGVTKQFITTLVQALVDKKIIERNEELLPIADSKTAPSMNQMGQFFSALFTRNRDRTDKFVIGNLFHPRFFELVKIALQEGSVEDKLKKMASIIADITPALTLAKDALVDPAKLAPYRETMGDEEANPKDMFINYLKAAIAFASGLTPEFAATLQTSDSKDFMTQMQGEAITKDTVLKALDLRSQEEVFVRHANFLKERIEAADSAWLEQFIFCITGNRVLPQNLKIQILPSERGAFEIHTCFSSINIPTHLRTKDDFLAGLDAAIKPDKKKEAITNDKVLTALRLTSEEEGFVRHAEFLTDKIKAADSAWLEQFVFCITGNRVLPEKLEIKISPNSRGAFEIDTRSSSIKIPIDLPKDAFLAGLDAAIKLDKKGEYETGETGYNIA